MTPDRLERIKELFDSALNLPPRECEPFVSRACHGDDALRAEVVRLLVQYESAHSFLETPLLRPPAFDLRPPVSVFSPEQAVGSRFRIVRTIGQGGMGEVYEAFDLELKIRSR